MPIRSDEYIKGKKHPAEVPISRRTFLMATGSLIASGTLGIPFGSTFAENADFEARYYEIAGSDKVRCLLCPRGCVISENKKGYCGVRKNIGGKLFTLTYGRACSLHFDPIEKKPFFHVLPGTKSFSLSTVGCNLECKFCQNWQISQSSPEMIETKWRSPEQIVKKAVSVKAPSISFTYGEPVVFIEYAQDIAEEAASKNIKSFVVTNGFYRQKPLEDLCRITDAIKIDLKSFTDKYYRDICGGKLKPVLDSIVKIRSEGVWLEIVYLMLPSLNDSPSEIRDMARWLVRNVGEDTPLHLSRFFPQYKLKDLPPTPVSSLETAYKICREEGLKFVYIGNVPGHRTEDTFCPACSKPIIERRGYNVNVHINNGHCAFCREPIPGIWEV
ncbi:MAG: AmmeMemoRadiSam system radical SAM enzyme [Candidatus Krumholzibacteriota bacterium]|nr:AmmeMemoRadiSam system radical SAM enzyme [Candidatus Krumholzibacteriota bacterium]